MYTNKLCPYIFCIPTMDFYSGTFKFYGWSRSLMVSSRQAFANYRKKHNSLFFSCSRVHFLKTGFLSEKLTTACFGAYLSQVSAAVSCGLRAVVELNFILHRPVYRSEAALYPAELGYFHPNNHLTKRSKLPFRIQYETVIWSSGNSNVSFEIKAWRGHGSPL